jgi:hypothetical protein
MSNQALFFALTFLLFLPAKVSAVTSQEVDIFSDEALIKEEKLLDRLKPSEKAKVRRALLLLKEAINTASVSTDFEEIAGTSRRADGAVNEAVKVIPNGVLKGTLISSSKALGASFVLRLLNKGTLDPSEPKTAEALEGIYLRFQLAGVPAYERPAKTLDYARAHLLIASKVGERLGIVLPK